MTKKKPQPLLVAMTGGPCAGKSTCLVKAQAHLEKHGIRTVILSEVATELISAGFSPVKGWKDSLDFQLHVLKYSIQRERSYISMLGDLIQGEKPPVILCDRGTLDGMAYAGEKNFEVIARSLRLDSFSLAERYVAVIHLVTAADGAEEFYTLDNNSARTETPEEARALDAKTYAAWHGHRHLFRIDNSTGFNDKVRRAVASLARVLHMEQPPLEKERKFVIENWEAIRDSVMESRSVLLIQDYLVSRDTDVERRVRKRILGDQESNYYTEKRPTGTVGERSELERPISEREYATLLGEKDQNTFTVKKLRYHVPFGNHIIEVDVYEEPSAAAGLVVAEVEVADLAEPVALPPGWKAREVTGSGEFSNRSIAKGGS